MQRQRIKNFPLGVSDHYLHTNVILTPDQAVGCSKASDEAS